MSEWIEKERETDSDTEELVDDNLRHGKPWLPCPLAVLFGRNIKQPLKHPKWQWFDQEVLMMELQAVECEDEIPDDGELEGSGDDYDD
jgi:hypothetical protein